ncbi:MAG TPA: hypothetical protein PLV70_04310 [Flavobacteriales bacterium]|nr:hypothetical protein [Flavobacteriales bacterium]HRP80751.1 hypothetical protein [Flavobacteriales bacterium]HRQ84315.1 hypothetical protein [Flavobacteriales bacterium]
MHQTLSAPLPVHSFHIPVMGLGYTIDTPVKVAHFGISSVISIIEDELVERMREYHSKLAGEPYTEIPKKEIDHRAQRITAYLNLVQRIVERNVATLRAQPFTEGSDSSKYFLMLADGSPLRDEYLRMMNMETGPERTALDAKLHASITPGAIDVNIMAKIDRTTYAKDGVTPLPAEYAEGMAAFRGFALSNLHSSIVLSAGYNPRIYSYIATFPDFFPDAEGRCHKKIILKVSDLRSAAIQGKILAKKGIPVSEFRIESGLNCGGHAFATDGILMGPILQEFMERREALNEELHTLCNAALAGAGRPVVKEMHRPRITVQGGIGTTEEDRFLRNHYHVDGTGWGSPFLLVPEATNVDEHTLEQLSKAKPDDYYLSWASPLGIPFHNFRPSTSEAQRKARIAKNRPGSACYKKFLSNNTEFTDIPICTASRQYQHLKLKQLKEQHLDPETYAKEAARITEKDCLCEGLGASALLKDGMTPAHKLEAVAICPGPNLANFSRIVPLRTMVDHIYGRTSLLNTNDRPHMFVNELKLYVDYLHREFEHVKHAATEKQRRYIETFKANLLEGIKYYENLAPELQRQARVRIERFTDDLRRHAQEVGAMLLPAPLTA